MGASLELLGVAWFLAFQAFANQQVARDYLATLDAERAIGWPSLKRKQIYVLRDHGIT